MPHLAQLKQQIKAIETTKKITHAVRLVSMSLYAKLEKQDTPLRRYIEQLRASFLLATEAVPEWKNLLFASDDRLDTVPLFVIVATNKGLCGSLNSNLFRYIESSLFLEQRQTPRFVAIGQRATRFVKEHNLGEIVFSYNELTSNNFIAIADDLLEKITTNKSLYSSVTFYCNEMKTFFVQRPRKVTLIPTDFESLVVLEDPHAQHKEKAAERQQQGTLDIIWEQSCYSVLDQFALQCIHAAITGVLFSALKAEHAARFLAMESSTSNAEKYLERLTLQYNKLRQALITKEVSELLAGSMDL